jgi:ubiquinone/menaquinone biosynthesis C-methylase UbiE
MAAVFKFWQALTVVHYQEEAERLDLQHRVFSRIFDGRLIFPPIPRLRRVLDCGYGTGSWAVDVATQYPDCRVNIVVLEHSTDRG